MIETNVQITLRAVLAGLQTDADDLRFVRGMDELALLAEACGIEAVDFCTQRAASPVHATLIGEGKVQELKSLCVAQNANLVIFAQSLSPLQVRNLGRILDCEVIDRTDLILRIFSERARTKEAKLQVEYARLDYMLPRLVGLRENLSRQGGTSGFLSARGAGETQLELDRRKILNRQAQLRRELKEVERARNTQRTERLSGSLPRVGLVGYTNAGKSTLMNALLSLQETQDNRTGKSDGQTQDETPRKQVFAEDMLFATLDTTVRRIDLKGRIPFLLSDTVGFISDLPASLIDAFRSTLAEAAYADLLLEVVDSSDPDHDAQSAVTRETLKEIGAGHISLIRVMNKTDIESLSLSDQEEIAADVEEARRNARPVHAPGTVLPGSDTRESMVYISAKTGEGLDALLSLIEETLEGGITEAAFLIPYTAGEAEHLLNERAEILTRDYREDGVFLRVRCGRRLAARMEQYLLI